MNHKETLRAADANEQHNRKTCRGNEHRSYQPDPDGAKDYDAEPSRRSGGSPIRFPGTDLCLCGGVAVLHIARGRGDVSRFSCSNVRFCDRLIPIIEGRTYLQAVEIWNGGVAADRKEAGL